MFEELDNLLKQDKKIIFVGIGNVLKRDDGVGVYISQKIRNNANVSSLTAEASIENYIGKINSLNADILVLLDCMNINSVAGTFKLMNLDQVQDLTFNTHNISLKRLSDFFKMPLFIIGIQPESIAFGENISYLVKNSADMILKHINKKEVHHGCRISL